MKFINKIRDAIIVALGGMTLQQFYAQIRAAAAEQFDLGERFGINKGKLLAKTNLRVLPLPFTEEQLQGAEYGSFITPAGFASAFGESMIPAPGPHGYEQRCLYVSKTELNVHDFDLTCMTATKFGGHDKASLSDQLVPVIVTVLR